MAPVNYFPPPPKGAALHREKQNSCPAAILRVAAALRVQPVSASGKRSP
jgi:hypothetical protein